MNVPLLTTLVLGLCGPIPHGPNGELRAALDDLTTHVPLELRLQTRYLSFYHLPVQRRAAAAAIASFVLNSVSRGDVIVRPQPVAASDGRLWRLSLDDYRLPTTAWEQAATLDSYWHLRTEIADKNGGVREVLLDGGWVDPAAAAALRAATGSVGPLLRGDFFLTLATTTLDGGLYYEFAGVPERESEFFAQLGLDTDAVDRLRADEGANLIRSEVTFKTRRIVRRQGPLGGAWHTYDTARSTPERDPLRNPFDFRFDAGEHIAAKRNGLHLYALFDAAGRRQASVPDAIAKDASDPHGSGIVVPMISCIRCHVEDGLRPFANDQRRLLESGVELFVESPADAQRLASFYLSDIGKRLRRDREDFAEATARATGGRTTAEVSAGLARLVHEYANELVDPQRAAAELGLEPALLPQALRRSHDPVLAALTVGIAVQRKQWEAVFGEASLLAEQVLATRKQQE